MYRHQEDFGRALDDRVLTILTKRNAIAAFLGGALLWQLLGFLGEVPWYLFYPLVFGLGPACGIVVTMRWNGISLLDQARWYLAWRARMLMKPDDIQPSAIGLLDDSDPLTIYADDGEVLVRRYVSGGQP